MSVLRTVRLHYMQNVIITHYLARPLKNYTLLVITTFKTVVMLAVLKMVCIL